MAGLFCGATLGSAWAVAVPCEFQRLFDPSLPAPNFVDDCLFTVNENLSDPDVFLFQGAPKQLVRRAEF